MASVVEKWIGQGIEQGIEQGSTATAREALLEVLRARFGGVPATVAEWVASQKDVEILRGLLKEAATTGSLEAFQRAVKRVG